MAAGNRGHWLESWFKEWNWLSSWVRAWVQRAHPRLGSSWCRGFWAPMRRLSRYSNALLLRLRRHLSIISSHVGSKWWRVIRSRGRRFQAPTRARGATSKTRLSPGAPRRGEWHVIRVNYLSLAMALNNNINSFFFLWINRKALPRWTDQVRVNCENGLEGPQEDGFSWRKYGQKDILQAKYPR